MGHESESNIQSENSTVKRLAYLDYYTYTALKEGLLEYPF